MMFRWHLSKLWAGLASNMTKMYSNRVRFANKVFLKNRVDPLLAFYGVSIYKNSIGFNITLFVVFFYNSYGNSVVVI